MKLIHYFYLCCWCLCCFFTSLYSLNEDRNSQKSYKKCIKAKGNYVKESHF